jgi:hypothetical protein
MNIKQAPCMARIVAPGHRYHQWLVQAVGKAPLGQFPLPDGHPAINRDNHQSWVCESFMHSPFDCPLDDGRRRLTRFAVIDDANLRPINDAPGDETFVTKARKTLPRAKPVTGPVTINARGEPA